MSQIYKATYSGVPVYELSCNGIAVMRRKNDSYMNATQILKVADFDKPQRTRILEREVQTGDHEKIQGGYGKYQGTWVPLERAVELSKHYNVDQLIQPLLSFVKGDESPPLAPKHVTAASAKAKKPRERRVRKRPKHMDDDTSDMNDELKKEYTQTPSPRRQYRRAALAAAATVAASVADSDMEYSESEAITKSTRHARHKRTKLNYQEDDLDADDLTSNTPSLSSPLVPPLQTSSARSGTTTETSTTTPVASASASTHIGRPSTKSKHSTTSMAPSFKSSRSSYQQQNQQQQQHRQTHLPVSSSSTSSSPTLSSAASSPPATDTLSVRHKSKKEVEHERTYAHKLLVHFLSENEDVPSLLQRPPRDLDVNVIIDDEGHTCLHWAAVMGRMPTVLQLIKLGADVYRVNYKGQTALMRSVLYTNNYEQKTFGQLLDLLSGTIFNIDKSDQTVFHHVATTANGKGKVHSSRYYMEYLINKLSHSRSELISILNVQDVCGDTALTIASRIGNKKLVRLLIDAGASAKIANEEGMTSQDYLAHHQHSETSDHDPQLNSKGDSLARASPLLRYQSEETTREQLRQKADTIYGTMMTGGPVTPSISHWVDDLAASYERDLSQKENIIKEKQREFRMVKKRLEETQKILASLQPDQQHEIQSVMGQGDQLAQEFRQILYTIQQTRLSLWIKEHESELREKEAASAEAALPPRSVTASSSSPPMEENTGELSQKAIKPPTPPTLAGNKIESSSSSSSALATTAQMKETKEQDRQSLEHELGQLQQSRRHLTNDAIIHRTSIPEKRIQNYKRLISMCCDISYDNVDSMLAPILASFDESSTPTIHT